MRNLEGILIEYFITGSIALIWIATLFTAEGLPFFVTTSETMQAVILISLIYVIGMLVDFAGKGFTGLLIKRKKTMPANQAD